MADFIQKIWVGVMVLKTVVARDWSELQNLVFENTWNPTIKRFRSTFAYRGVSNANFKLSNGLSRLGPAYPLMEKNLIKQFKKYSYPMVQDHESEWHLLSVAQHHGLPTRFLDWTYSPLAAIHFATADTAKFSDDGAIWMIDYSAVHSLLQKKHQANLDKFGARIFSTDALADTILDLDALDSENSTHHVVAIFFEPPALDQRIVNQFAYFSALSDPFMNMDDWLDLPQVMSVVEAKKIIIPAHLKWEARDKLDQSNINERVLFPGLDGLCAWLKRHYQPA